MSLPMQLALISLMGTALTAELGLNQTSNRLLRMGGMVLAAGRAVPGWLPRTCASISFLASKCVRKMVFWKADPDPTPLGCGSGF
jgi:hypothetical protein